MAIPSFSVEKLKEVMQYNSNMTPKQLAIKAFAEHGKEEDSKHINSVFSALRRDIKNQTMSDVRLDRIAQVLNCNVYYLRGDIPNATYDPERFGYDSSLLYSLKDYQQDLVRYLIYLTTSNHTYFTYGDVQKLTDEDILEIMIQLSPEIDRIVKPILNRRIYGIDTTTDK